MRVRCSIGGMVSFSSAPIATASRTTAAVYDVEKLCKNYNLQTHLRMVDVEGSERIMLNIPRHFLLVSAT